MIDEINKFIQLANENNLKTTEIRDQIFENIKDLLKNFVLHVKVSFGAGQTADIPWVSITRNKDFKEDGPVFLYYKLEKILILSFCVKEEKNTHENGAFHSKYNFKWNDQIKNEYKKINEFFNKKVKRYGDSYVYKAYNITDQKLIYGDTIRDDLLEVLKIYKKQLDFEPEPNNLINNNISYTEKLKKNNLKKAYDMEEKINKNLVLYGPPGTGKTYNIKKYAVAICENLSYEVINQMNYNEIINKYNKYFAEGRIQFTTFHQSYSYEDFIEGIFPELDSESKQVVYNRVDGVFKSFCQGLTFFDTAWNRFKNDIEEKCFNWNDVLPASDIEKNDKYLTINSEGKVLIPDKEGTTFTKDKAIKIYKKELIYYKQEQKLKYIFDYFIKNYFKVPKVFIIDEINRGNISKIFGELITLIEENKREGENEEMFATLPYSKKSFSVPNNIFILGTMNTADRSIVQIDTALRRRFDFVEMMSNPSEIKENTIENLDIAKMLETINKRINALYDRDHEIGHAYFIKENMNLEKLASIFMNNIIPLLKEYFQEDYEKIRLILGDNAKTNENFQFIKKHKIESSIFKFGSSDEDIEFAIEYTYSINKSAFKKIESYKQII